MEKAHSVTKLLPNFKPQKKHLFLAGSVFFGFFILFTLAVRADLLVQFDFDVTVKSQDFLARFLRLQQSFCSLSVFGHFETLIVVLIGVLLLFRKWWGIIMAIGFFGFAHVVEIIGKFFLHHPNPPQFFIKCHNPIFPTQYVQPGHSYPSGHSMRTVFIAVLALYFIFFNTKLNWILKLVLAAPIVGIVILMLVSRVSLGEHWPTDVIGGSLLGVSFSLFSLTFLQKIERGKL